MHEALLIPENESRFRWFRFEGMVVCMAKFHNHWDEVEVWLGTAIEISTRNGVNTGFTHQNFPDGLGSSSKVEKIQ